MQKPSLGCLILKEKGNYKLKEEKDNNIGLNKLNQG